MRICISETKNGYAIFDRDEDHCHKNTYVAESTKSLIAIIADIFGEELESVTEEEKLPAARMSDPPEEIRNAENNPINDDEEPDESVFIIPAAAAGGGESIQEGPIRVSGDTPDPASEERLSESRSTDTGNQENYSEGNRETVSLDKGEPVSTPAPRGPVSKGHDRQSQVLKPQPYTPENTGLPQMQLSVLQVICHLEDLNKGPVTGADINEHIFPPPSNLTTLMKPLIKKGFIEKHTEGRSVMYLPLKRPDGRKYEALPVTEEDGVPVIHCEPRNIGSRSNSEGGLKI